MQRMRFRNVRFLSGTAFGFLPENFGRKTPHSSLSLSLSLTLAFVMGRRAAESVAPSRPNTPPGEQELDEVCSVLTRMSSRLTHLPPDTLLGQRRGATTTRS